MNPDKKFASQAGRGRAKDDPVVRRPGDRALLPGDRLTWETLEV